MFKTELLSLLYTVHGKCVFTATDYICQLYCMTYKHERIRMGGLSTQECATPTELPSPVKIKNRTPSHVLSKDGLCLHSMRSTYYYFLVLAVNSDWFKFYVVTRTYSSHLFLCALTQATRSYVLLKWVMHKFRLWINSKSYSRVSECSATDLAMVTETSSVNCVDPWMLHKT